MGEREWYWWLQSEATVVEQFYRVEINVALDEAARDNPLYTLVAFMSADLGSEVVDESQ
jgi:general secretion pathway protein I